MTLKLKGAQQRTYDSIFAHPISHNLGWRDLRPLFESLGSIVEEPNGNVMFTRNGHVLVIHPETLNHNANPSKLVEIRHFLRSSASEEALPMPSGEHLLVVINHHEANVYRSELHGSVPQKIVPYDPHGFERHIHNMHDHSKGQHHPVPNSFFEAVSKTLQGAKQILIFGTATGGESAMQELVTYLHNKHKDLFEHVIGALTIDETHLTESQILSKAREFYASKWAPVKVAVAN
jgi:hypothetical protein